MCAVSIYAGSAYDKTLRVCTHLLLNRCCRKLCACVCVCAPISDTLASGLGFYFSTQLYSRKQAACKWENVLALFLCRATYVRSWSDRTVQKLQHTELFWREGAENSSNLLSRLCHSRAAKGKREREIKRREVSMYGFNGWRNCSIIQQRDRVLTAWCVFFLLTSLSAGRANITLTDLMRDRFAVH